MCEPWSKCNSFCLFRPPISFGNYGPAVSTPTPPTTHQHVHIALLPGTSSSRRSSSPGPNLQRQQFLKRAVRKSCPNYLENVWDIQRHEAFNTNAANILGSFVYFLTLTSFRSTWCETSTNVGSIGAVWPLASCRSRAHSVHRLINVGSNISSIAGHRLQRGRQQP